MSTSNPKSIRTSTVSPSTTFEHESILYLNSHGKHAKKQILKWVTKAVESDKDDCEIELRCPERDSVGKYGRALGELWVLEDNNWTNVNKWMCENGYAVPYVGQNKNDVRDHHMLHRKMLAERGELVIDENGTFLTSQSKTN